MRGGSGTFMVGLFVLLLLGALALFYGPSLYTNATGQAVTVAGVAIQDIPQIQVILASSIAFLQFAIVVFSLLDRIADTFKFIIKPIAVLLPLAAFLLSSIRTFGPILAGILPGAMLDAAGANTDVSVATWVTSPDFAAGVLITLGTMLLFLVTYKALTAESAEVKALRAELARTKKALR